MSFIYKEGKKILTPIFFTKKVDTFKILSIGGCETINIENIQMVSREHPDDFVENIHLVVREHPNGHANDALTIFKMMSRS